MNLLVTCTSSWIHTKTSTGNANMVLPNTRKCNCAFPATEYILSLSFTTSRPKKAHLQMRGNTLIKAGKRQGSHKFPVTRSLAAHVGFFGG